MNSTKAKYNEHINKMSYDELQKESSSVQLAILKGKALIAKGQFPQGNKIDSIDDRFPMRLLKWKRVQVLNLLNKKVNYNG